MVFAAKRGRFVPTFVVAMRQLRQRLGLVAVAAALACDPSADADAVVEPDAGESASWLGESKSDDTCPPFHVGVNYAWERFGADFGGLAAWQQSGVRGNADIIGKRLTLARDAGATVVRWWLWPDFRGDGIMFAEDGTALGLTEDALADIDEALAIADEVGIDLMLCFFSFDAHDPKVGELQVGHPAPNLAEIIGDDAKRAALIDNVVVAAAQRVHDSPHSDRLAAWDLFNEPAWAIEGKNPYGDPRYTPMDRLTAVSHEQMETLLAEMIAGLDRVDPDKLVSVGAAAFKWSQAWSTLDTDFHHFHMYDWIDAHWPYDEGPGRFGLDDKPVFMGEIHFAGVRDTSLASIFSTWRSLGYLGAMGWSLTDPGEHGEAHGLDELRAAAQAVQCSP